MNGLRRRVSALALWPWHPLLLAAVPVLRFWAKNFRLVPLADGAALMAAGTGAAVLLTALLRLLLKDWGRAGLAAAPLVLVLVQGEALGGAAALGLVVLALALAIALRLRPLRVAPVTGGLNAALAVLVLLPVVSVLRDRAAEQAGDPVPVDLPPAAALPADAPRPDVYYLLVDGLGRASTVGELFRFDASVLTAGLERRGAVVLPNALANYPQTGLSVASTLNMAPVQQLLTIPDPQSRDRRALGALTADSRAVGVLRTAGYRVVAYPSGYPLTRLGGEVDRRRPVLAPGFLDMYVLNESIVPLLSRLVGGAPSAWQDRWHRRNVDYILDHLGEARRGARADEPVFVFAHLLAPHPPFVYGADGGPVRRAGLFSFGDGNDWTLANPGEATPYGVLWRSQAAWIVRRLEAAVDAIVAASPRPPVIIIQGDHGPGSQLDWDRPGATNLTERFGIFSAWILPPVLRLPLRPDQTAMATFPALFAGLAGRAPEPVDEGIWFARMKHPYTFLKATAEP